MTTIIEPSSDGNIGVRTETNGIVHRRVIAPGSIVSGVWTPTDLSGETQEIQDAANNIWTAELVASFRANMEQVNANIPQSQSDTSIHKAYFRAALASMGKINAVDNAAGSAGPIRKELWASATDIDITDSDVIAIANHLNIDLDAVLAKAKEIKAGSRG